MALSRVFVGSLALILAGTEGARTSRKRAASPQTKFVAGVPVLNYDQAYQGHASLSELETELEEEWVVMVKPGTSDAAMNTMCKASRKGCNLIGHPSGGVPFLEMRGTEVDLERVLRASSGAATFVEPDQVVYMIPEIEAGGLEAATWGLNRIGADNQGRTGAGVSIYILDTGVRVSHQEFGGRATPTLDMTVGAPRECNGDARCAADLKGHGTHCAGTAAGENYGVAPRASLKSIKALSDGGPGQWSWIFGALDWVAHSQDRPAVASMSLGGSGTLQASKDAIDSAVNVGVTVVVAAGNNNDDACRYSPAFVPSAITVGATTSSDERSSFSNFGSCTNIWAPGTAIRSADYMSDTYTRYNSGTSMACPHVAGGAALILAADPTKKAPAVLAELTRMAEKDALTGLKEGDVNHLLNVREPYTGPPTPAPKPPTPAPTPAPPPPGTWKLKGAGCQMAYNCIFSNNHPGQYGANEKCRVRLFGDIPFRIEAFDTEARYDKLSVGGIKYSGTSAPPSGSYTGVIRWNTNGSVTRTGWRMCRTDRPDGPA